MPDTSPVLVLFSGGRDSFLVASRIARSGRTAVLLSLDNGATQGITNVRNGADRLIARYGERVVPAGTYGIASTIWRLDERWTYMSWKELGETYPALTNVHVRCLHCQTAMWIASVAYAKANRIQTIAAGYRSDDEFCTGIAEWIDQITALAERNGISTEFPLWETPEWGTDKNLGRNMELLDAGFVPKTAEARCLLGRPARKPDGAQRRDMDAYFRNIVEPHAQSQIENLTSIMSATRLSNTTPDSALFTEKAERYMSKPW